MPRDYLCALMDLDYVDAPIIKRINYNYTYALVRCKITVAENYKKVIYCDYNPINNTIIKY